MKQIILVMAAPPLPFGRPDSRWYYVLLKELVARGYHVTAFVACESTNEINQTQALFPAPDYDVRCYRFSQDGGAFQKIRTLQRPYSYIFSQQFHQDLAARLAVPYDVLHLEQLWSGWLGLKNPQKAVVNIHYLFSEDQAFQSPNTWKNRCNRWISYGAEQRLIRSFSRFMTLSDRLTQCVHKVNPQAAMHTVPLGMDLSRHPFTDAKSASENPVVGLVGSFNWGPSYTAAERLLTRLWPEIKRQVPTARLQIVGRAAKTRLASFANLPDVELYQDVPDVLPYFNNLDVMLYAPVAGSGMKVKVMEAFALGTPVVTTKEGVEGLPAQDGIHAGVCEEDAGLIERTVALLQDPNRQETQRRHARSLLELHCSPQATVTQVETVYQAISLSNAGQGRKG
jgi:polysaccharide biosynthesis protein PslH